MERFRRKPTQEQINVARVEAMVANLSNVDLANTMRTGLNGLFQHVVGIDEQAMSVSFRVPVAKDGKVLGYEDKVGDLSRIMGIYSTMRPRVMQTFGIEQWGRVEVDSQNIQAMNLSLRVDGTQYVFVRSCFPDRGK